MERVSLDGMLDTEKLLDNWPGSASERDVYIQQQRRSRRQIFQHRIALFILTTSLIVSNFTWWKSSRTCGVRASPTSDGMRPSEPSYFLAEDDPEHILIPFEHDWRDLEMIEDLGSDGHPTYRYADVHWGQWAPENGSSVAVSGEMVEKFNLSRAAAPLKDNATDFHYLVAGYHQLHCLSEVRDTIYYLNGTMSWEREEPFQWDHILHCIEAVRQALHCNLDPTLIPLGSYWPGIPNGQLHVCRNSDALYKWTSEHGYPYPEHNLQAPPARTKEWHDRAKHLNLPPWMPDPNGPPVDKDLVG